MKKYKITLPGLAAAEMPEKAFTRLKKILPEDYNKTREIDPSWILDHMGIKWLVWSLVNPSFEDNEPGKLAIDIGMELVKSILHILELPLVDIDPELLGKMMNMMDQHLNGKFKEKPLNMDRFYGIARRLATRTNPIAQSYAKSFYHARLSMIELFEAIGYYANDPADPLGVLPMTLIVDSTERAKHLEIMSDMHMAEADKQHAWAQAQANRYNIVSNMLSMHEAEPEATTSPGIEEKGPPTDLKAPQKEDDSELVFTLTDNN